MGLKALSKVQLGRESSPGTPVDATFVWRGPFAGLADQRTVTMVDEQIGIAMKSSRNYTASLLAALSMPVQPMTPEQVVHLLEAGVKSVGTGVADGTDSSGFVYAYPMGKTAVNTIKTYTIETGDDVQAEEAAYCFVSQFTISGVKGESLQMSAEWFGRTVADTTFTAALTPPAISHIHASAGTLYIDDNDGSFGATQVAAGNILEFNLQVVTGWKPLYTADSGQLYFVEPVFDVDAFEATLEIKWRHTAAARAELAKYRANAPRLVRLEFAGEDYETAGTGSAFGGKKGFRIDFPGTYESFTPIEFEDGQSVISATLKGGYDNDSAEGLAFLVANEIASL